METTLSDQLTDALRASWLPAMGDATEDVALRVIPKPPSPPANNALVVSRNTIHLRKMATFKFTNNMYSDGCEIHSSEGQGDRGKRTSNRAQARDLRSITVFQQHEPSILVEILCPQSPFITGTKGRS